MVKIVFHIQKELHDKLMHVFRELQIFCILWKLIFVGCRIFCHFQAPVLPSERDNLLHRGLKFFHDLRSAQPGVSRFQSLQSRQFTCVETDVSYPGQIHDLPVTAPFRPTVITAAVASRKKVDAASFISRSPRVLLQAGLPLSTRT
jgi:hypothetical protein